MVPVPALMWEQTRFVATGSLGVAEMHARDVAATGSSGLSETAVMMWFYAVAVTMTDGEKCVDTAARDAHLDYLRGPEFEPVLQIVRSISDDRLAAMRDLAIRLETVLAEGRTDDTMCRTGDRAAGNQIRRRVAAGGGRGSQDAAEAFAGVGLGDAAEAGGGDGARETLNAHREPR